jgi:hypothetical protein
VPPAVGSGWSTLSRGAPAGAAMAATAPAGRFPAVPPPARIAGDLHRRPAAGTMPRTPEPKRIVPASASRE